MKPAYALGTVLDERYRLLRQIGKGSGGIVYEAENVRTHLHVAIKLLHAYLGKHEDMRARFNKEAQVSAAIGSEHVVRVFDLGELPDGTAYLVMERLDGEDLLTWLSKNPEAQPEQLAPIALQVLDALVATHEAGIIHRDIKPDNVFLTRSRDGLLVKILDFGVSKFLASKGAKLTETQPGMVVGSPSYMSPEQARGQTDVDARTDIYSLGVILFECLTGRLPFESTNFNDLLFQVVLEDAPHPLELRPDMDPAFAAIVGRAMKRDRTARFQSAAEFRDALRAWMDGKRSSVSIVAADGAVSEARVSQIMATSARSSEKRETAGAAGDGAGPASKRGSSTSKAPPPPPPPPKRSRTAAIAALLLLGVGAVVGWRMSTGGRTASAEEARAHIDSAPAPAPPPTPALTAAVTAAAAQDTPPTTPTGPTAPTAPTGGAAALTPPPTATTAPAPLAAAPRPHGWAKAPRAPASAAPVTAAATVATAAAAPEPPPAPTTKRPDTVEGRAIRTEL